MRLITIIALAMILAAAAAHGASVVPTLPNAGFEDNDLGWAWVPVGGGRGTHARVTDSPHSGKYCEVLSYESLTAPNVYVTYYAFALVNPETEYQLTAWVRAKDASEGVVQFTDWNTCQLSVPGGTYGWKKLTTRFRAPAGMNMIQLRLNIAGPCKELAVDDISLMEVSADLKADGLEALFAVTPEVMGNNAPAELAVSLDSSKPVVLEASVTSGDVTLLSKTARVEPGEARFLWEWGSGTVPYGKMQCNVRLLDSKGSVLASATREVRKVENALLDQIDAIEARFEGEFMGLYRQCERKGIDLAYPNVAKETLDQFMPLARIDARLRPPIEDRAQLNIRELNQVLDAGRDWMSCYLRHPELAPVTRRYVTSKVGIDGTSFVGDRLDSSGKRDRGPVFFVGYGHFIQVRTDMPRWQNYGINIIQVEIGPSVTLTDVDEVSLGSAKDIVRLLDDAAKQNVMVNVLLSPHYFPTWALEKWPKLAQGGGGFLGYCIDEDEAKTVLAKFVSIVVPMLKGHPALHSFTLANEPSFERAAGCANTREMWTAYLRKTHGDIGALNERYGTSYVSFADVPCASTNGFAEPQYYDYTMFVSKRLADWHMFMADSVRRYAPNVPLHTKWRAGEIWNRRSLDFGVDPELYTGLDINGNDCWFCGGPGDYACNWREQNRSYDLQRSLARKPIFNSENHPTFDRKLDPYTPEHFQACLWEGAIRGQGATTMWVWERSEDRNSDLFGNVMDRPACAEATGRTCLDLNRFSDVVTALQNVNAPVAILYTQASEARNANYLNATSRAYEALMFCGTKIDWITEKQLSTGKGSEYRMIVLPDASNVHPATLEAIEKLPSTARLVWIGDSLARNPYGQAYPADRISAIRGRAVTFEATEEAKAMWPVLRSELRAAGSLPRLRVVDAETGEPAWGVEYLPTVVNGRSIVYMINLGRNPIRVKLVRGLSEATARDLLSLGGRQKIELLKPMAPALAEL